MKQKYSEDQKLAAVLAYSKGQGGLKNIAAQYGVEDTSLSRWVADYRKHGEIGIQDRNEFRRRYTPEFKEKVILNLRGDGLSYRQAGVKFNIRRFHAIADWERRYDEGGLEALRDRRGRVKERIRAIFELHKGRYGYRRIVSALQSEGKKINHKTVLRLMQSLGLQCCVRMKKYRSYRGQLGKTAPNILARGFSAPAPNQKWVTDVTEFRVGGEKLYLSPILDLYNGEIVAFENGGADKILDYFRSSSCIRMKIAFEP